MQRNKQTTNTVLMVKPVCFAFNLQTAANNAFQEEGYTEQAQEIALEEFNHYVTLLRQAGVQVIVAEDTPTPHTPDSIFPNNWFSTHSLGELSAASSISDSNDESTIHYSSDTSDCLTAKGNTNTPGKPATMQKTGKHTLVLYPMFAPNRRAERDKNVLNTLKEYDKNKFLNVIDLTGFEGENKFLEGTGSLILDRENKIAYGCLSPRTNEEVLEQWADQLNYNYFLFEACDENGTPVYHTNVMMSIGTKYAIVCLDAVQNLDERVHLIELLEQSGKQIIELSLEQINHFAGNMLEVEGKGKNGEPKPVIVMSATAKASLDKEQLILLQNYATLVVPNLEYIEKNGGGSARCMIAEIF